MAFAAVNQVLLPQRFKDAGMSHPESLVASLNAAGALVALFANVLLGAFSDRSRSRVGRRTPFIVVGSLVAGVSIYLTYAFTTPSLIILLWCGFQLGLNALLAPFVATMSDRIPENGRATMSAVYGIGLSIGGAIGATVGKIFINSQQAGFLLGAIALGVTGILVTLIWPKEPSARDIPKERSGAWSVLRSFIPPTRDCRDFYIALVGRLLMMMGYYATMGMLLYVLESYVGLGKDSAASTLAIISVINMVVAVVASLIAGYISDHFQRRKVMVLTCAAVFAVSFVFPFFWAEPWAMIASAAIGGFALGIYNACDGALNVDVLPSKDEAGKDLGFLNLSNTVGQVLGPIVAAQLFRSLGTFRPIYPIAMALVLVSMLFIVPIRKAR